MPRTPAALCRSVLHADGKAAAFFAGHDISDELRDHLGPEVEISDEERFGEYLHDLGGQGKTVLVNKTVCPRFVHDADGIEVSEGQVITIALPRPAVFFCNRFSIRMLTAHLDKY